MAGHFSLGIERILVGGSDTEGHDDGYNFSTVELADTLGDIVGADIGDSIGIVKESG